MLLQFFFSIGSRKKAKIYINLKRGSGYININKKSFINYFKSLQHNYSKVLQQNLLFKDKDLFIIIHGGGISGQFNALHTALWKLLSYTNVNNIYKQNLLTTDIRNIEQKKYGLKKARKQVQYSKR